MCVKQSLCYMLYKPEGMSLDEQFRIVAGIGYAAIELWGRGDDFIEVVETAHKHGLVVASMCGHASLPDGLQDARWVTLKEGEQKRVVLVLGESRPPVATPETPTSVSPPVTERPDRARTGSTQRMLGWIGLGTWETPSEIIPEQHLEAWQLSMKNQLLGNENALRGVRRRNRNKELLRLIREVPITSFGRLQAEGRDPEDVKQELLLSYREKLRNAWEIYQNNDRSPSPELEAALKHLTRLTARWLV